MGKKGIEQIFEEQNKQNDFRQDDIIKYRNSAKETLKKDLEKRYFKIEKEKFPTEKITKEKIEKREYRYGQDRLILSFERQEKGKNAGKLLYRLRNYKSNRIEAQVYEKQSWTKKEHEDYLRNRVGKKGFDFEEYYIKEDTEPKKEFDKRKDYAVVYTTYYRWGIIIYRMKDGRKYEIIYRNNGAGSPTRYLSYQNLIAEVKSDILRDTRITLEEWIYLSKTKRNIYVEGGIHYKRMIGNKQEGNRIKGEKIDYEYNIDFGGI